MKKQIFNPYLPLYEYIPDGEPHVFGDRVYVFGSHDKEGGETFCMLDYTFYSAPVTDLTDWRCEGVIYKASQDPDYNNGRKFMYAPDVCQGNDGRYYLYYCMSGEAGVGGYFGPISVAVCDSPAGQYEYLGFVKNKDGTPMKKYVCFDPGVINDNGTIRIYYGTRYDFEEQDDFPNDGYLASEMGMFNKTKEEILSTPESVMGPSMVTVEDDMLTVKDEAVHIIPYKVKGTDFEEHPFFEASSIRKIDDTYYFIYSSMQNHELCYATSKYPDRDFKFGGTIVSNGDIGVNGVTAETKLNMTGTTHGSIEKINGKWYVFYHRLTHKSDYSRQGCAEPITIEKDGSIRQVEITSCGLNGGPLVAKGIYPAPIACNITNGKMPHGTNRIYTDSFPNVNHQGNERFIAEICDNTLIGFKYFKTKDLSHFAVTYRGEASGSLEVFFNDVSVGRIEISKADSFIRAGIEMNIPNGVYAVYLKFNGEGIFDIRDIIFD